MSKRKILTNLDYMELEAKINELGGNASDLIFTESVGVVEGEEPTMSPIVDARFAALENRVATIEAELGNSVARLSVL